MDGVLAKGENVEFFHDEYRCPVYVKDVVTIIKALIDRWLSGINPVGMVLHIYNLEQ